MCTDRQHEHMHTPIENESAKTNDAGAAVLAHNLEKYARDHHCQQMVRGKRCGAVRGHARERVRSMVAGSSCDGTLSRVEVESRGCRPM